MIVYKKYPPPPSLSHCTASMYPHSLLLVAVMIKLSSPKSLQENSPATNSVKTSLPFGCSKLTVGDCNAAEDEMLDTVTNIPDPETCQMLCQIMAADRDCKFFTHSEVSRLCVLYHNRYLDSCNTIGGPAQPTLAQCTEDDLPTCESFIQVLYPLTRLHCRYYQQF